MAMVVALHDVSQRFGQRWVVSHVSVAIPAGTVVLLTGDNGAGKTTLLRIMATAVRPSRGRVHLFGQPAREALPQMRQRLALMTHQYHVYEALSAWENLQLVCRLRGPTDAASLEAVLEEVGLGAAAHVPVGAFSAGMKRRLTWARLLLRAPELALLDEPFGQLDAAGVSGVEAMVKRFQARGATVVMATHDLPRGRALCQLHLHMIRGYQSGPLRCL